MNLFKSTKSGTGEEAPRKKQSKETFFEKKKREKAEKEEREAANRKKNLKLLCGVTAALLVVLCCIGALGSEDSPEGTLPGSCSTESIVETTVAESIQAETETTTILPETTERATEPFVTTEPAVAESTSEFVPPETGSSTGFSLSDIGAFSGQPYTVVNQNIPYFTADDLTTSSYELYAPLDSLGRCGVCVASIGVDLMPTEERGEIGMVKPTGWHTIKYDCVDGRYLYNRCHLIGFQLSGENANRSNLITGTRYLNIKGMLPFENMVADYVKETENHVLYRVTPMFRGDNMLADGVLMEGWSVEDNGEGICYCIFAYNAQPGVVIDYTTGDSYAEQAPINPPETQEPAIQQPEQQSGVDYILNTNSKKFHYPSCPSVKRMKESNKEYYTGSREDLISRGYEPCKNCNP